MSVPTITPLTNLPSITDPANFDARADNLITVQFPLLVSEINAAGEAIEQAVEDARDAASVAINGTSTSSVLLGTGSKSFTVLAGHSWSVGTWLMITSRANPSTHWFVAQVTAYAGTLLTVSVHSFGGSGSRADWDLSITAKPPGVATTTADGLMSAADKVKVNGAAPVASPALTGIPTAPTATAGSSNNQVANTAFVAGAVATATGNVVSGAPSNLNTLDKLAASIGDDPAFAATQTAALSAKFDKAGGTLTGGVATTAGAALTGTTLTPAVLDGNVRSYANAAAFTLNAPTAATAGTIAIMVTNAASGAGALTASGFSCAVKGTFSNVANKKQLLVIEVYASGWKTLTVRDDT